MSANALLGQLSELAVHLGSQIRRLVVACEEILHSLFLQRVVKGPCWNVLQINCLAAAFAGDVPVKVHYRNEIDDPSLTPAIESFGHIFGEKLRVKRSQRLYLVKCSPVADGPGQKRKQRNNSQQDPAPNVFRTMMPHGLPQQVKPNSREQNSAVGADVNAER